MAKGLGLTTAMGYILVDTTLKCGITNTYTSACAGSKGELEEQLATLKQQLATAQRKSDEVNGKLERYHQQVADANRKVQECSSTVTSLKVCICICGVGEGRGVEIPRMVSVHK